MNCTGLYWLVTKVERGAEVVVVVDGLERGAVCQEDEMAVVVVLLTVPMPEDCWNDTISE